MLQDVLTSRKKSTGTPVTTSAPGKHSMLLTYRFRDSQDPLKIELNTTVEPDGGKTRGRQLGAP